MDISEIIKVRGCLDFLFNNYDAAKFAVLSSPRHVASNYHGC